MAIHLSIENQKYLLIGRPETVACGRYTISIHPGSHGINTKHVQDIVIRNDEEYRVMHLSGKYGKSAMVRFNCGDVITAIRDW